MDKLVAEKRDEVAFACALAGASANDDELDAALLLATHLNKWVSAIELIARGASPSRRVRSVFPRSALEAAIARGDRLMFQMLVASQARACQAMPPPAAAPSPLWLNTPYWEQPIFSGAPSTAHQGEPRVVGFGSSPAPAPSASPAFGASSAFGTPRATGVTTRSSAQRGATTTTVGEQHSARAAAQAPVKPETPDGTARPGSGAAPQGAECPRVYLRPAVFAQQTGPTPLYVAPDAVVHAVRGGGSPAVRRILVDLILMGATLDKIEDSAHAEAFTRAVHAEPAVFLELLNASIAPSARRLIVAALLTRFG